MVTAEVVKEASKSLLTAERSVQASATNSGKASEGIDDSGEFRFDNRNSTGRPRRKREVVLPHILEPKAGPVWGTENRCLIDF